MEGISKERRDFLKRAGLAGSFAMMPIANEGWGLGRDSKSIVEDAVIPQQSEEPPKNHIKFAVCGMSHDHIHGMVGAIQRGGGELVSAWGGEEDKIRAFAKGFPGAKIVKTQDAPEAEDTKAEDAEAGFDEAVPGKQR